MYQILFYNVCWQSAKLIVKNLMTIEREEYTHFLATTVNWVLPIVHSSYMHSCNNAIVYNSKPPVSI